LDKNRPASAQTAPASSVEIESGCDGSISGPEPTDTPARNSTPATTTTESAISACALTSAASAAKPSIEARPQGNYI